MSRPSEDDLIARHFAPLAGPGSLALKDDAALLASKPGFDLVLTCDALVAGVHFFPEDPPEAIAAKALRVNLSDLASKGAVPAGFLLALALPHARTDHDIGGDGWLSGFAEGLRQDISAYGVPLLGGDTVSTPGPLTVSITALGHVPQGRMVPRTGARAGDALYVSGTIGDAALGLQVRLGTLAPEAWAANALVARYLRPQPRLALGPALLAHARAAMDLSDGLIGDLAKMMRVSGTGARLFAAQVPLSEAAKGAISGDVGAFKQALTGGDDYEILASVAPDRAEALEAACREAGVPVTRIGDVTPGPGVDVLDEALQLMVFDRTSYTHF